MRYPERLQVLYRPSVVDRVSAEEGKAVGKVIATAATSGKLGESKRYSRMMFSGTAAGAKANILFDTGASNNFVSSAFARQTGISVKPVDSQVFDLLMTRQCLLLAWPTSILRWGRFISQ